MSAYVDIHEFSTGIHVERTADGGWVSASYTGQFMNVTSQVPEAVERSISNSEFAVTEGAYSDQPALIGRVVPDSENGSDWSVVAIVSKGRDDFNRSAQFYRYFLCEAEDGIWNILTWIENYEREQGFLPVFNPFEKPESAHRLQVLNKPKPPLLEDTKAFVKENSIPIIIPRNHSNQRHIIHEMAARKASEIGQPISWAVNVESLRRPERFLIIYPASDQAYVILQQAARGVSSLSISVPANMQSLEGAINKLMNSPSVKPEAVQIVAKAIESRQMTRDHWRQLFDGQGATKRLQTDDRTLPANRLLTLRAMLLPETLPNYLQWLNITDSGHIKTKEQKDSLEFQEELYAKLSQIMFNSEQLYFKLDKGIAQALSCLRKGNISVEALAWVLSRSQSVWRLRLKSFLAQVDADLRLLTTRPIRDHHQFQHSQVDLDNLNYSKEFWSPLRQYLQDLLVREQVSRQPDYIRFAKLFELLGENKLASYFYQVSKGKVPHEIFIGAFLEAQKATETEYLGLRLNRDILLTERIDIQLDALLAFVARALNAKVPIYGLLIASLVTFLIGRSLQSASMPNLIKGIGSLFSPNRSDSTTNQTPDNDTDSQRSSPSPKQPEETPLVKFIKKYNLNYESSLRTSLSPEKLKNAEKSYERTRQALNSIVQEISSQYKDYKVSESNIKVGLKRVLELPENFDISKAMTPDATPQIQEEMIKAVYKFQYRQFQNSAPDNVVGYIGNDKDAPTPKLIKRDLSKILDAAVKDKVIQEAPISSPPSGNG